jgi:hypothetical protein
MPHEYKGAGWAKLSGKPDNPAKMATLKSEKESFRPRYSQEAVQKEINKDKRIGGREAKRIHALLKGRT